MDWSIIIERVDYLCQEKGIDKHIYTKSGAGKDFMSNIKKKSTPSIEKVLAIASYLDCSIDYLLGRTENPTAHIKSNEVNNQLFALLEQLTPAEQEMISFQIKGLLTAKKDPPPKGSGQE